MITIIKRIENTPPDDIPDYCITLPDRQYHRPLCGCDNFTGELEVGNVIGIKLQYETTTSCTPNKYIIKKKEQSNFTFPELLSDDVYIEEHLFTIIKIRNNKFYLKPYYIDTDKVLLHQFDSNVNTTIQIPKKMLQMEYLIYYYLTKYEDVDYIRVNSFDRTSPLLCHIIEDNIYDKIIDKEHLYFPNMDEIIIYAEYDNNPIKDYYKLIDKNREILIKHVGEDIVNRIGTYEKLLQLKKNQDLYQKAYNIVDDIIDFEISYYQVNENETTCSVKLSVPVIKYDIGFVKLKDIYRVYTVDSTYKMTKSKCISNWHGKILDEKVRTMLKVNEYVRVSISDNDGGIWVIYVDLLYKLSNTHFLGISSNYSSGELYEDYIIIVDIRAISEIPYDYDEYILDNNKKFLLTGIGVLQEENETYPITYDKLFK